MLPGTSVLKNLEEVVMKKVVVRLLLGLFLLGFVSGISHAEKGAGMQKPEKARCEEGRKMEGMRHRGMGMIRAEHRIRRALRNIGLDEKQKEALRDIRSSAAKEAVRKRADFMVARIDLRDMLDKDPVDMAAVEAKLKQIGSIKTDMHLLRIKTIEEIKSKLTPEQRQKFRTNLRRDWKWHGRWGRGAGEQRLRSENKEG